MREGIYKAGQIIKLYEIGYCEEAQKYINIFNHISSRR